MCIRDRSRLCAFVHGPLTNPLTDKVVRGARTHAKAIVRFLSWENTSAKVLVQEEFQPLNSEDVVSMLHVWRGHTPTEFFDYTVPDWWTNVGDDGDTNTDAVQPKKFAPLGLDPTYVTRAEPFGIHFENVEWPEQPEKSPSENTSRVPASPPASTASQVTRADDLLGLEQFIHEHHAKSSRGDINGLMDDYASTVEHQGSPAVSRATIRKQEVEYHAPGYRITEKVRGAPEFRRVSPNLIEASYELSFVRVKPDGAWISGVADVLVGIEIGADGARIVKQRSTTRDSEKRRGDRNPPVI